MDEKAKSAITAKPVFEHVGSSSRGSFAKKGSSMTPPALLGVEESVAGDSPSAQDNISELREHLESSIEAMHRRANKFCFYTEPSPAGFKAVRHAVSMADYACTCSLRLIQGVPHPGEEGYSKSNYALT